MITGTVKVFKALANETRLKIVRRISRAGELSCHDISRGFPLSQPTLSHHFNKLIAAGILTVRREGTNHYYAVNQKLLTHHGIRLANAPALTK